MKPTFFAESHCMTKGVRPVSLTASPVGIPLREEGSLPADVQTEPGRKIPIGRAAHVAWAKAEAVGNWTVKLL